MSPASLEFAPNESLKETHYPLHSFLKREPLAAPLAPAERKTIYRVTGISHGIKAHEFQQRLESAFCRDTPDVDFRITVGSFAKSHHDATQTATFSINSRYNPPILSNLKNSGNVELHIDGVETGRHDRIYIDKAFEGLTVLSDSRHLHLRDPGSDKDFISADFIAVHGLGGHPIGSWTNKHNGVSWLTELSKDSPTSRVLTYGYSSALQNNHSFQDLRDIAHGLVSQLRSSRIGETEKRPLVFIGHSLGGLVVKQALVQMRQSKDPTTRSMLGYVSGMTFLGTPREGLDVNKLGLSRFTERQPNQILLDELSGGSCVLSALHQNFLRAVPRSAKITSFYETETSPTAIERDGKIVMEGPREVFVDKENAFQGRRWERNFDYWQPLRADHSGLAKPAPYSSNLLKIMESLRVASGVYARQIDAIRKTSSLRSKRDSGPTNLGELQLKNYRFMIPLTGTLRIPGDLFKCNISPLHRIFLNMKRYLKGPP